MELFNLGVVMGVTHGNIVHIDVGFVVVIKNIMRKVIPFIVLYVTATYYCAVVQ